MCIKITVHFPHPVNFIRIYFICSLINCMVSWVVVGGPQCMSLRDSQVYFDIMVIISIFGNKGVSTAISRIIHFNWHKKIPTCRTNKWSVGIYKIVSIRAVVIYFIQYDFTRIKTVDGNVVRYLNSYPEIFDIKIITAALGLLTKHFWGSRVHLKR